MKRPLLVAIAALAIAGCGPSEREVGAWVLLALPMIAVLGTLLQLGYRALWRRAVDRTTPARLNRRPTVWLIALSCALFVIPFAIGEVDDELLVALWAAGTTYAAYLCLAMRATITSDRRYAFSAVVPWLLIAVPAVLFALFGSTTEGDFAQLYYMLPGYAGLVPGGMVVIMVLEIAIRHHLRRKTERAAEPVFPEARTLADFDEVTPENPRTFVARTMRR